MWRHADRGGDVSKESSGFCSDPNRDNHANYMLAMRFKALGHPVRLEILKRLSSRDSACCGDLVGCMVRAQSTVSQHLQVLKEAGLVECHVDGRKSCYRLNRTTVEEMQRLSNALFENFASLPLVGGCTTQPDRETDAPAKKEVL